ncbi:MAG TPA: glycosyltransferase [Desulfuromonadales bacterium]|nr:glycosyltransferase [Desulfuromonadales bacterium]
MKKALLIFAREPLPGLVKTRLAASIGIEAAASLYDAMLQDVLSISRRLIGVETVVFWACDEECLPRLAERYRCSSRRQQTGDLGQRMQAAFEEMFASGCEACCIIGSDSPDLPLACLDEAFIRLADGSADTVFGPCHDGGYYLLGLRKMIPSLFSDISWSTPLVFEQSLTAAQQASKKVFLLPEWYDVDTLDDLHALQQRRLSAQ